MRLPHIRSIIASTVVGACALAGPRTAYAQATTPSQCDATVGNLIRNCGFEVDGKFANWLVTGDNNFVSTDEFFVHSGNNGWAAGTVEGFGTISQTFETIAGQSYDLSFWYHASGFTPNGVFAAFNDVTVVGPFTNTAAADWTQFFATVTATGTTSSLTIGDQNNPDFDGIDDIAVTATPVTTTTPEPASLALLGTGMFGLAGVAVRGRRKQ